MTTNPQDTSQEMNRLEIASDWLLRIQAGSLEPEELAEWVQWHDADPANREAFEEVQAIFESVHGLPSADRSAWAARLQDSEPPKNAQSWLPSSWFSRRLWVPAFATALAFLAGVVILQIRENRTMEPSAFKTERATHRDIPLPDGSRVRLGAKSQLSVNFTSQTRYLVLEGGEAFFDVAKDAARPFLVQAGQVTIRAVGTEFNVRRVMDQTIVAVTEGSVDVLHPRQTATPDKAKPIHLVAGELVSIGPLEPAISVKQIEPKAVNAWQEGRLEFSDEPLGMVIDTINRYSLRDVVITDQALSELRFTGTVSRDRIDEWLSALSEVFPVDVRRVGNETVLISRRSVSPHQDFRFGPLVR